MALSPLRGWVFSRGSTKTLLVVARGATDVREAVPGDEHPPTSFATERVSTISRGSADPVFDPAVRRPGSADAISGHRDGADGQGREQVPRRGRRAHDCSFARSVDDPRRVLTFFKMSVDRPPDPATGERHFRWRNPNVSRIENFADIVFALTIALLGTMELPKSATELAGMWRSLVATGFCFAIIFAIWHAHYIFFRRYDLMDAWTVFLNSLLLFMVFAFAYPLKFVMNFVVDLFTLKFASESELQSVMSPAQARWILILYSLGYAVVFFIFTALYRHASNNAERMSLSPTERILTSSAQASALVHVVIALLVIVSALLTPPHIAPMTGMLYFLIGPGLYVVGRREARALERILQT